MPRFRYPRPPSSAISPPDADLSGPGRRRVLAGLAATGALLAPFGGALAGTSAGLSWEPGPHSTQEPPTDPEIATSYCNFFEFGPAKDDPARLAGAMVTDPWALRVDGAVEAPLTLDLDDLRTGFDLEERVYRLRCVEAWSKIIPWIGFPLADLLSRAGLRSDARYVEFVALHDPETLPGQRREVLDWPYREGLRIDEAMHPLTLLAVGMYGAPLPNQNGAPVRLVVPWKYGFKSIKSVVGIRLLADRPVSSWEARAPREYGFYANVNPQVRHPRWHQATERRLGQSGRIRTEPFNGYGELVADLYRDMDLTENF